MSTHRDPRPLTEVTQDEKYTLGTSNQMLEMILVYSLADIVTIVTEITILLIGLNDTNKKRDGRHRG